MIEKMKNKKVMSCVLLFVVLLMYGCIGPYFKEGVLRDNRIQEDYIQNTTKQSSDIFDFVQKIYATPPVSEGAFMIVYKNVSENASLNYWDTDVFRKYCEAKNGDLFSITFTRNYYAFSGFNGISKVFYTCEINNDVDSTLIYEVYGRGPGYSGPYQYEITKKYAKKDGFYKLMSEYKFEGYTSNNKVITLPATQVNKKHAMSDQYSFIFYYKNDTDKPQTFDFLNSSYVNIKGIKYDIDFSSGSHKKDPINWLFYQWADASNYGVFVGDEGKKLSRLKFNPTQKIFGEITFKIPGFTSLKEDDLSDFVLVIDGKTYTNFKKITYYDLYKQKMK